MWVRTINRKDFRPGRKGVGMTKSTLRAIGMLCILAVLALTIPSWAIDAPITADCYIKAPTLGAGTSGSRNYGTASDLVIGQGRWALMGFNLSTLPDTVRPSDVAKATLSFWVNRVNYAGAVNIYPVTNAWNEYASTIRPSPILGPLAATVPVGQSGMFVQADITGLVRDWVANPSSNQGICLVPSGLARNTCVALDSKENTATSHIAKLDIALTATGPQGPEGPQGPQGLQGSQGIEGPQGPIGPAGPADTQGTKGDKGDQGEKGDIGDKGNKGDTGPQGAPGLQGPQGAAGVRGDKGEKGDIGLQGQTGSAGPVGSVGPVGPAGLTGATGPQGPIGPVGSQGPMGFTGSTGSQGSMGPQGPSGAPGAQGPQGLSVFNQRLITSGGTLPDPDGPGNGDYTQAPVDVTSGPVTLILPLANSVPSGRILVITHWKGDASVKPICIQPQGSDKINDDQTLVSITFGTGGVSYRFYSDGASHWRQW